jgi:bifunctional non-homologous end joining protein LigD
MTPRKRASTTRETRGAARTGGTPGAAKTRRAPAKAARPGKATRSKKTGGSPKKRAPTSAKRALKTRAGGASPAEVEAQLTAIERGGGDGELELGRGVTLHVSSLGKVYFREGGITKGDLMRYYTRVSPVLLPEIAGRPLILKRYPEGAGGQMFFQQDAGPHVPDTIPTMALRTEEKGDRQRIIGGDLVTLLYTVQLGAIEVHPWLSRVRDIESPDRCLIDLDPGDGVPFSAVVDLARDVLRVTTDCGLSAAVKTSGSSGIHIVIALPPRTTYQTSALLASQISQVVATARPERATVERSIGARPAGTIYVDAMQNARGKSAASAYSVRAKPGATVSAPLAPRELAARLRLDAFTLKTMPARVAKVGDLFGDALRRPTTARALDRALTMLDSTLTATRPRRETARSRRGGTRA